MREQSVFLPFDARAVLPGQARVLLRAHLVERLSKVAKDVEFVEQDRCLWGILACR